MRCYTNLRYLYLYQHACVLVFMPMADIVNILCDYQFVFSVLREMFHTMLDLAGNILRVA